MRYQPSSLQSHPSPSHIQLNSGPTLKSEKKSLKRKIRDSIKNAAVTSHTVMGNKPDWCDKYKCAWSRATYVWKWQGANCCEWNYRDSYQNTHISVLKVMLDAYSRINTSTLWVTVMKGQDRICLVNLINSDVFGDDADPPLEFIRGRF